jgi:peptidyl-prolyl cis-trans isomerase SurA
VIKEQMIAEKVQGQILEHVKVTPAEVEAFYKKIPVDSLPVMPASLEVGQIVSRPAGERGDGRLMPIRPPGRDT